MSMVILVGLPGSGKSTFCTETLPNFTRVNQDLLGSRAACIAVVKEQLENGKDVVIDRVNHTAKQRSYWLNLGRGYNVDPITAVYLVVPEEECIARIHARKDHPTIKEDMSLEKKKSIVYKFNQELEIPSLSEGFNSILIHRNH